MIDHLTPKQVGLALGVSEASVKRWCDAGKIQAFRTAGGHRRLAVPSVIRFLRESGADPAHPEILGLPPSTGRGERRLPRVRARMREALEAGESEQFRRLAFNLYLGGVSCAEICDECVAGAFHDLGEKWEHGSLEVYQERRGCDIALRLLHELGLALPEPSPSSPRALGGTIAGDAYTLASTMASLVLREEGWNAQTLGVGLPPETIAAAITRERPALVWLSVSTVPQPDASFLAGCDKIHRAAVTAGAALALGGRALTDELRERLRYTVHCDRLRHLAAFARSLHSTAEAGS